MVRKLFTTVFPHCSQASGIFLLTIPDPALLAGNAVPSPLTPGPWPLTPHPLHYRHSQTPFSSTFLSSLCSSPVTRPSKHTEGTKYQETLA